MVLERVPGNSQTLVSLSGQVAPHVLGFITAVGGSALPRARHVAQDPAVAVCAATRTPPRQDPAQRAVCVRRQTKDGPQVTCVPFNVVLSHCQ